MTKPRIGWIGTGLMGARMAGNLLRAGYPLAVWNRTREKVQPLLDQGATWAASWATFCLVVCSAAPVSLV